MTTDIDRWTIQIADRARTAKLYAVLRLPGTQLQGMRPGRSFLVPGTDRERTLERMSVPEVHALVAALLGNEDSSRAIARVVAGYRQRLSGLVRATVLLLSRRGELARETAPAGLGALVAGSTVPVPDDDLDSARLRWGAGRLRSQTTACRTQPWTIC